MIYHLETYDITTIRASTPMYLMARAIKSLGIKMVLSGEGLTNYLEVIYIFIRHQIQKNFMKKLLESLKSFINMIVLELINLLQHGELKEEFLFLTKFIEVAMRINPKDKMIKK